MNAVPLETLRAGEEGRIVSLDGDDSVNRLAEMGLRRGAWIRMLSPGAPCIILVDDHRMTLRLDGRVMVLVELGAVA